MMPLVGDLLLYSFVAYGLKVRGVSEDIIQQIDTIDLTAQNVVKLDVNDITVSVDSAGRLWLGQVSKSFESYASTSLISCSGLWVAHDDPIGATANHIVASHPSSNYSSISNGIHMGPYSFFVHQDVPCVPNGYQEGQWSHETVADEFDGCRSLTGKI